MENRNLVIENVNNPNILEQMYRDKPAYFIHNFSLAFEQHPDSAILKVWFERLNYDQSIPSNNFNIERKEFIIMGTFAILSGVITRLLFYYVELGIVTPINLIFGIVSILLVYFMYISQSRKFLILSLISVLVLTIIYINFLPNVMKDSIFLSYLHLPIFLWVLIGTAFMGNQYKLSRARLSYLKFNGEFIILYAMMAICGIILTGITMQLFSVINLNIAEFYFSNIVLIGASSLIILASYLVIKNINLAKNIAPFIAKIFSPLVLITLVVYLVIVLIIGENPFNDRDFLLTFNIVLIMVLAITIFSITERQTTHKDLFDWINFMLIVLALFIDSIALSAIVFRLSSFGISPNRLAVLGINVIVFINLTQIVISYYTYLIKDKPINVVQDSVTSYLPIYGIWSAFVTFIYPLIF